MKALERISMGRRGQGVLVRFEGSANWVSCYCVRGKEHRESTGTADLKKARKFHNRSSTRSQRTARGSRSSWAPSPSGCASTNCWTTSKGTTS
jgi:hypothetical protein